MYNYRKVVYVLDNKLISQEMIKTLRKGGVNVVLPSEKKDVNGNPASFIASSLNQLEVPTYIYTSSKRYETMMLESDHSLSSYYVRISLVGTIASNLYKRGISSKIVYKRGENQEVYDVNIGANLYKQLDDFYGILPKEVYKAQKESEITEEKFNTDLKDLKMSVESVFGSAKNFEKQLRIFERYADVYGMEKNNPVDLLEFYYIQQHREIAEVYIDNKFICPHCKNIVKVNNGGGAYNINNGLYYNQGITICEHCYTEFDIHDKQDILDLAHNTAK